MFNENMTFLIILKCYDLVELLWRNGKARSGEEAVVAINGPLPNGQAVTVNIWFLTENILRNGKNYLLKNLFKSFTMTAVKNLLLLRNQMDLNNYSFNFFTSLIFFSDSYIYMSNDSTKWRICVCISLNGIHLLLCIQFVWENFKATI